MALPTNHLELTIENDVPDIPVPSATLPSDIPVGFVNPSTVVYRHTNSTAPPPPYDEESVTETDAPTGKEAKYAGSF